AEGDLGELLTRAEAVVHRAAREAPLWQPGVDAAAEIRPQVWAGLAGGLVDREVGRRGERRRHAAQRETTRAVGAQVGPVARARGRGVSSPGTARGERLSHAEPEAASVRGTWSSRATGSARRSTPGRGIGRTVGRASL